MVWARKADESLDRALQSAYLESAPRGVSPVKVRLWESLDQYAEYSGGQ